MLSPVTKLSSHWICGPSSRKTLQDFCEIAFNSPGDNLPAPGTSRSMMYFGIARSFLAEFVFCRIRVLMVAQHPKRSTLAGSEHDTALGITGGKQFVGVHEICRFSIQNAEAWQQQRGPTRTDIPPGPIHISGRLHIR